jgi:hypothetical protein
MRIACGDEEIVSLSSQRTEVWPCPAVTQSLSASSPKLFCARSGLIPCGVAGFAGVVPLQSRQAPCVDSFSKGQSPCLLSSYFCSLH